MERSYVSVSCNQAIIVTPLCSVSVQDHLYDISWWKLSSQIALFNDPLPFSLPLLTIVQPHDVDPVRCPDVCIAGSFNLCYLLRRDSRHSQVDSDRVCCGCICLPGMPLPADSVCTN